MRHPQLSRREGIFDQSSDGERLCAYDTLSSLVQSGAVELYLILSPPRTLSTVWGKTLARQSDVGLWLNEPTSKFHSGEDRVKESYETILAAVQAAEPSTDGVKRLVLSIITSTLGPDREARRLFDLSRKISFLVRNPALALESFLILIGRINGALGNAPDSKEALLRGGWLEPGTDLRHIADDDPDPWGCHLKHLAKIRDYRSLTAKYMHCSNNMLASKAYRLEAWSDPEWVILRGHPEEEAWRSQASCSDWGGLVARCAGLEMEELERRAPFLSGLLTSIPNGWLYARRHLALAHSDYPEKLAGIADASEVQLCPDRSIRLLQRRMGLAPAEVRARRLKVADGYGTAYAKTGVTEDLMFGRALASEGIDPPDKAPIALDRFPWFVRAYLSCDFASYLAFLKDDDQLLRPFGDDLSFLSQSYRDKAGRERNLAHLDPVYAYIRYAVAGGPDRKAALRAASPQHRAYFDLIDGVQEDMRLLSP